MHAPLKTNGFLIRFTLFTVGHWGCQSFHCELKNDCLETLIKRGTSAVFFSECFDDKFVEAEKPTPFFAEYFEKNKSVATPFMTKIILNLV